MRKQQPTGAGARRARTVERPQPRMAAEPDLPPALAGGRVTVSMRCDECAGEGTISLGPETARRRQCRACRGAGTLTAKLSFEEFRALRARWGF
jgi:hypothetical protein